MDNHEIKGRFQPGAPASFNASDYWKAYHTNINLHESMLSHFLAAASSATHSEWNNKAKPPEFPQIYPGGTVGKSENNIPMSNCTEDRGTISENPVESSVANESNNLCPKGEAKKGLDHKMYPCNSCPKKFNQPNGLSQHNRTHSGDRPYNCEACGKTFSQANSLAQHKRIHTGEKPYLCRICGKAFSQANTLTQHTRIHTGEKPFVCKTCGKPFTQANGLAQHNRTHTGEKPYSCSTCGKAFSQANTLAQHKRTHSGEKPYFCEACGKTFSQANSLAQHRRTHNGERPYVCNKCGEKFGQANSLSQHAKLHFDKDSVVPMSPGSSHNYFDKDHRSPGEKYEANNLSQHALKSHFENKNSAIPMSPGSSHHFDKDHLRVMPLSPGEIKFDQSLSQRAKQLVFDKDRNSVMSPGGEKFGPEASINLSSQKTLNNFEQTSNLSQKSLHSFEQANNLSQAHSKLLGFNDHKDVMPMSPQREKYGQASNLSQNAKLVHSSFNKDSASGNIPMSPASSCIALDPS